MDSFEKLGLPEPLLRSLEKINFTAPTPIQAAAIPLALKGRDILGSAQTGTGKTAAFGIPLLAHLLKSPKSTAIVMSPTRELAAQILKELQKFLGHGQNVKSALLIGGDSMYKQLQQLRAKPRLIVGTPGRINDHLEQKTLSLKETDFLVLDETDRMLDMGFDVQIERILNYMPAKRQTLLFSATMPAYIVKLADKYLSKPERVAVGSTTTPVTKIDQELVQVKAAEKYTVLLEQLAKRTGSVIVFVKTKHGADRLARKLNDAEHAAEAIHGDLSQSKRNRVIQQFRNKEYRIMVATDVAARGLDIPHIEHVINYDLPQVAEDYIHRIGRTGRAGATGSAAVFIAPEDKQKWHDIHFLINPNEKSTLIFEDTGSKNKKKSGGSARGTRAFAKEKAMAKEKSFSKDKPSFDRKPRTDRRDDARSDRGDRQQHSAPRFDRDDRRPRRDEPRFERRERDSSADFRKPKREGFGNGDRRRNDDRDGYGKRESFGTKPRRDFGDYRSDERGERKPRFERSERSDRPARGDRPARSERSDRGGKSFGSKPKRFDRDDRSDFRTAERKPFKSRRDDAPGKVEKLGDRRSTKPAGKKFAPGKPSSFGGAKRKTGGGKKRF